MSECLQIGKYYPPHRGGIESLSLELSRALLAQGNAVKVLCYATGRKTIVEQVEDVEVTRAGTALTLMSAPISFAFPFRLRDLTKSCDVIHFHYPNPFAAFWLFVLRPRRPIVVHWHSDIVRQRIMSIFFRRVDRWLITRAVRVIATSGTYARSSRALARLSKDRKAIVPCPANPHNFPENRDLEAELRGRWTNRFVIFSVGRLVPYKGFRYLIEAARYLSDRYLVVIGGDGPLFGNLYSLIRRYRLENRVELKGSIEQSDIGAYYRTSHIVCVSSISRAEAQGIVAAEGMLFSKPIVTSAIPGSGLLEANVDGKTGLVVPPRNPQALARSFRVLAHDASLVDQMGRNSHMRYLKYYSIDSFRKSVAQVYELAFGDARNLASSEESDHRKRD